MIKEPEHKAGPEKDDDKGPIVEVTNLNTNDSVKFHANWETSLSQIWDTANTKFGETRNSGDELLCEGGESLMPYLTLTLAQLREKKVCQNRKYQIRRPTGGAAWRKPALIQ